MNEIITPLRDQVLVELRPEPAPAEGLIAVARLATPPTTFATVRAIGDDVRDVRVGADVVISRLQGIEVGNGFLMLPESAVLANA